MDWVKLDEAKLLADLPTGMAAPYDAWVLANPAKAGRLAELGAQILAQFRDAIATNPANDLDPDPDKLPAGCIRSAEDLIYVSLRREIPLPVLVADGQAATRAEMFLRQIAYGRYLPDQADEPEPSPRFREPTATTRTLP